MASTPLFLDDLDRDSESAWKAFVEEHTDMILAIVSHYLPDEDLRMDAYLFALEGFRADDYRRFRKYRERERSGDAPFIAWLKFVTRNLALDFVRHWKGRRSLPKVIEAMHGDEQFLFRCLYWDRMTYAETLEHLRARGNDGARIEDVARRAGALATALADSGHPLAWGASRMTSRLSFDDPEASPALEARATEAAAAAGYSAPQAPNIDYEARRDFEDAERLLGELRPEERLLLQLKYESRLGADEIARIVGAPTAKAVYNRIARIIERLRSQAAEREVG